MLTALAVPDRLECSLRLYSPFSVGNMFPATMDLACIAATISCYLYCWW